MRRIVTLSHTHSRLSDETLDGILHISSRRNRARGLSGILLYKARTFFQVLEGPEDVVEDMMTRIYRDPRHHLMKVLYDHTGLRHRFNGWQMGFRRMNTPPSDAAGWFSLTRSTLESRLPAEAAEDLMHLLRSYLDAKLPEHERIYVPMASAVHTPVLHPGPAPFQAAMN